MNITTNCTYKTPNFKATRIATTRNCVHGRTSIDIIKLSQKDKSILEKLSNKISIKKFCPNLSSSIQERWQRVFDFCIQEARNPDNETYIAVSNKKPCAILTYHRQKTKNNYLDGVCAIPDEKGEKTPLAGQTLIYQLFKDSNQSNDKRGIVLEAIHNGPVNVIDKYEKLGFTAISSDGNYTLMTCNKFKVAEELKKFKNEIEYIETDPEKIDSKEFID